MGTPVRIAYLIPSLRCGGAENQLLTLVRHLDRAAFDPFLVLFEPAPSAAMLEGVIDHADILGIDAGENSQWARRLVPLSAAVLRLVRLLRAHKTPILHSFLPGASIVGAAAARLAGVSAFVYSRRSLSTAYRRKGIVEKADRAALRFADMAVGNSEAVRLDLLSDGVPADHTATIANGVDTKRFHPAVEPIARHKMGWTGAHFVVAYVANFHRTKRHCDFLEFAGKLWLRHPNCRFLLAGRDRGELGAVRAQLAALGLDNVTHIEEYTERPEHIYTSADLCVSTSDSEGMSNVLLEASACERPVIATDVGGNGEVIVDGLTGLLVPPRDPSAMAAAAEQLFLDSELRTLISRNARNRAVSQFSIPAMVNAYERLYLQVLRQKQDSARN
jgi:glycosyltransferase involved in cell wall biosynthesis